ncbi:response regulator transcription factor [Maribacter litopenaei]|uniref:Response regulator transcription factor n=1 Tax=Maribacter litopenaei TaxID=2976127 RepID=A0ABY5Y605_9FLAO|nr:response regulator transcription factor [Maribacter litopenaei]UWX54114.1 response regulator transcription factor [Maribacter litopenaei]
MMENRKKILLVEDDEAVGYLLSEYLQMKGFSVSWAKHGKDAIVKLDQSKFDLAVLDVMMPEMDGFTLAEKINKDYPDLPFIFLTAKSLKVDVLKGFYLGAVDYLKKPIDEEELVIRIENLLSRLEIPVNKKQEVDAFIIGKYRFNSLNQELIFDDQKINLTVKESELLKYLVEKMNLLCPHKDILIKIWGKNDYFNKKSLNVFITRLRKFLERDPNIKIENVHSKGYILRYEP